MYNSFDIHKKDRFKNGSKVQDQTWQRELDNFLQKEKMNNFRINIFPDLFLKNGSADGMSSFTPKWDQESKVSRNKVGLITE